MDKTALSGLKSRKGSDAGFTLASTVSYFFVAGILLAVMVGVLVLLGSNFTKDQARSETFTQLNEATAIIARDVFEAQQLIAGEDKSFTINTVRYGKCQQRTWDASTPELTVYTKHFAGESCFGDFEDETEVKYAGISVENSLFTYFNEQRVAPLVAPLNEPREIRRIGWSIGAVPAGWDAPLIHAAEGALTGLNQSFGDGTERVFGDPADLRVTTSEEPGKNEGADAPILKWIDPSPEFTSHWVVYRQKWWEGETRSGEWEIVSNLAAREFTDVTDGTLTEGLKNGETAAYYVRAMGQDGTLGPASNQVITGLRPNKSASLDSKGGLKDITLSWSSVKGVTSWDVYRSNSATGFTEHVGNIKEYATDGTPNVSHNSDAAGNTYRAWVDVLDYGHSHKYKVVAVNRWETLAESRGVSRWLSDTTDNFTAPAKPAAPTVEPTDTWGYTVTHKRAAWTGYGSATNSGSGKAQNTSQYGKKRDDTWQALESISKPDDFGFVHDNVPVATASKTKTHTEASVGGKYGHYRTTVCNASGCSPQSNVTKAVQRPATAKYCYAESSGTQHTHQMTVKSQGSTFEDNTTPTYFLTGGEPAQGNTIQGTGEKDGTKTAGTVGTVTQYTPAESSWTVTRLKHGTSQSFTVKMKNSSTANNGWSPEARCGSAINNATTPATPVLPKATIQVKDITTRSFSVELSSTWGGNKPGGSYITSLSRVSSSADPVTGETMGPRSGTPAAFGSLVDNRNYRVTVVNSDGYNEVTNTLDQRPLRLATPSVTASDITSRAVTVSMVKKSQDDGNDGVWVTRSNGVRARSSSNTEDWIKSANGGSATHDKLKDKTDYTAIGRNTDGFNTNHGTDAFSTKAIPITYVGSNRDPVSCRLTSSSYYAPSYVNVTGALPSGWYWNGANPVGTHITSGTKTGTIAYVGTDGHNDETRYEVCSSVYVAPPPVPNAPYNVSWVTYYGMLGAINWTSNIAVDLSSVEYRYQQPDTGDYVAVTAGEHNVSNMTSGSAQVTLNLPNLVNPWDIEVRARVRGPGGWSAWSAWIHA